MRRELHRSEDAYGSLIITQKADRRVLSFDEARLEQSCVLMQRRYYLSHEYSQIMLLGLVFSAACSAGSATRSSEKSLLIKPQHITVLGLGGGAMGHCLQHFLPHSQLVFVERRQAVIDLAYEWFELPRSESLQVVCADAFDYLKQAMPASTELILSDLYEARGMSECQAQQDFIQQAYNALTPNACLVINFHQLPEADSAVMQCISERFAECFVCDVYKGNWVLFCLKTALPEGLPACAVDVRRWTKAMEMPLLYYFRQLRPV